MSDRNIGRELKKLSNKIHREIDKFASKSELTGAEGRVLHYILGQEDDVYQRDRITFIYSYRDTEEDGIG